MKKLQAILLLGLLSCQSREQVLDFITPDSFSLGKASGMNSLQGYGEGGYGGQYEGWRHDGGTEWGDQWSRWDIESEVEMDMFWLEWDLPSWEEETKYEGISVIDIERVIESRVPTMEQIEKAIDARIPKVVEVPVVVENVDVQEVKKELKRELSPIFIAGFFAFLGLLGGVFLVSKIRR